MEKPLGFSGTTEDILAIWNANAERWPEVGSPWRPSVDDVALYKELAGNALRGRVLILGSTPELRDMAHACGSQPVVVDISFPMLQRMARLASRSRIENEVWVKSDWHAAPLPAGFFDLVLGDMIWWVLSVPNQAAVRDMIGNVLKRGGLFVGRIRFREPKCASEDAATVIGRYAEMAKREPARRQAVRDALVSRLHDITADAAALRIRRAATKELLLKAVSRASNACEATFLEDAARHLLSADWTSQTREELLPILKKRFAILEERHADDYESESYPTFAFSKE